MVEQQYTFEIFTSITFWITVIVLYFTYWIFCVPINWIRDLVDVGYSNTVSDPSRKCSKESAINRARRLRKFGDCSLIPPPFPNGWFALIESERVKIGQVVNVTCLGQQFVVFRTGKKIVHVLDAYCPHMGANLGIGGIVRGDCIECPFHQWSFRGEDGKCTNIPYSSFNNIPKTAKLKKWISKEINDFIFIWYHAENDKPWKLSVIESIDSKKLVYVGRNEFLVNCHIQEIPENGADIAHFSAIHSDSIFAGNEIKNRWCASFGKHIWDATWQPLTDPESQHIAAIELQHCLTFFATIKLCTIDVKGKQIGPSYVEMHMSTFHGPVIVLQTVTPIEPMVQRVVHRFYAPWYAAPFAKLLALGESIMFERDIKIWNHKMFKASPYLVKEDRSIKAYRNWYKQFYSENSETFIKANETLEW